ncbi:unnamed protein product [Vitrella brassicaformis CCMP3155]|uniref:Uncharacterized protein n=1 Tax=Vitrella brassicaformis (strain CCMP3155) TaxID=1169540 RepID=A0A0G4EQF4_VITBC|nr:unnamed protein product [Vitrella brassicaformis CCMP3155]|eukprot:CEM00030.1 unnamed protein product [Vitrella brassicaformis CCMP3155]
MPIMAPPGMTPAGGAQGGPFAPSGPEAPMQASSPRAPSYPALPDQQHHQPQPSSFLQPCEPLFFAHGPFGLPPTVPPNVSHPFSVPPVSPFPPPPPYPSPGSAGDSPNSTASSMHTPYRREPTLIQSVNDINDMYQMNGKLGSGL